jgi:hypothetical protein
MRNEYRGTVKPQRNPRLNLTGQGYLRSRSVLEGHAERVVMAPDKTAAAKGPEAIKGYREVQRHDLQVLGAICDVANGARLHTGFLAEKYQCCFQYFRSADRSTLKRAFPSIKTIKIVRHVRNLNA